MTRKKSLMSFMVAALVGVRVRERAKLGLIEHSNV
jgi:hypothetical protein